MARTLFRNLAVPVVILVLWQLLSQSGFIKPVILPSPLAILERLWTYLLPAQTFAKAPLFRLDLSSELLSDLVASMRRVLLALPWAQASPCRSDCDGHGSPVRGLSQSGGPVPAPDPADRLYSAGDPVVRARCPPAIFLISIGPSSPC